MTLQISDRVVETTNSTGTGDVVLAGAVTGYRTFGSVLANADTCYYTIEAINAQGLPTGDWETGLGTYNSATNSLSRTTVKDSSNAGAAVNLIAGTKRVFLNLIAAQVKGFGSGGGGGGGGGSLTKILDITLAADVAANAVAFSVTGLPQTYDDIQFELIPVVVGSGSNNTMSLQFNGDTGANYAWSLASRFEGQNTDNQTSMAIGWLGNQTTLEGPIEGIVFNYASTSLLEKHMRCSNSAAGGGNYFRRNFDGVWHPAAAAAINRMDFSYSNVLKAGSRLVIYGRGGSVAAASGSSRVLISDQILAANAATVAFNSIPTNCSDLLLEYEGRRSDANSSIEFYAQFNGDTGANYQYYTENRFGTGINYTANFVRVGTLEPNGAAAGLYSFGQAHIFGYMRTDRFKNVQARGFYQVSQFEDRPSGVWKSNAAITSLLLMNSTAGFSFAAGSRFRLYGLP